MRLAREMREPDVNALLDRIPFWQFLEWKEYDAIDPIGGQRGDWQAASICCAFMNGIAVLARSKKRFRVKDFLLEFGDPKEINDKKPKKTWQEMKFIAKMFVAASKPKAPRQKRK